MKMRSSRRNHAFGVRVHRGIVGRKEIFDACIPSAASRPRLTENCRRPDRTHVRSIAGRSGAPANCCFYASRQSSQECMVISDGIQIVEYFGTMLLNLRKQNFRQVIGLQTTLARPETLEVPIVAVSAEGIGARRQDGQENMGRPIAGIKKLLDGLGEGCTDRKAPRNTCGNLASSQYSGIFALQPAIIPASRRQRWSRRLAQSNTMSVIVPRHSTPAQFSRDFPPPCNRQVYPW